MLRLLDGRVVEVDVPDRGDRRAMVAWSRGDMLVVALLDLQPDDDGTPRARLEDLVRSTERVAVPARATAKEVSS